MQPSALHSSTAAALLGLALTLSAASGIPAPALPRPLTLEAALGYAAEHNPGLLRTREVVREQEGVLVEVRAGLLPTLGTTGSYSRVDDQRLESPLYSDRAWSVDVTVKQLLYSGGGTQAKVRSQREQLEAARLTFTAALNDTLLSVHRQFYAVLLDRELIGVQEEAQQVLEAELAKARHRREAGSGSDFDILRAEVAVANSRPALIRARNTYRNAQDQLRATLGSTATDASQPTDLNVQGALAMPRHEVALIDAITAARAHRPELLQQERLAQAAEQGIVGARSGYQPTVSAVAGYEWAKPSLLTTPQSHLDGWTAGLQASWNIFDGRATSGRVAQARARANQVQFATEERQLAVEIEVRQAHSSLAEADELLTSSEKVVEQARESLRLSQSRFQAGIATQLDVLTAQSSLTQARSNLAQAQHDYAVASAALNRATGLAPGVNQHTLGS